MIDDMSGLYSHASDAYRAGKKTGRDELKRAVGLALSRISVKYEKSGSAEQFHVAEECCKALREIAAELEKPQHAI